MAAREEFYAQVKDLLSREAFDRRIQQEMEAWGGLLDEAAAALVIVDELGRNEVRFGSIGDLYEGGEALFKATIEEVGPVREFDRRDGTLGHVVNLTISDSSGSCRLVLWDEEVDLATAGALAVGGAVKIVDGYVRRGRYGLEVITGKWGLLLPETPPSSPDARRSRFRFIA